ncbi:MAG: outer membrane beta-barrel protein [Muribaculaceae bacterium]|nr:outer membrane beta-barrel protein [Muribaculaceae bacterium]
MIHHIARRCVAAFVSLAAFSSLQAYNIRGVVTDPDGEALVAATVKLLNASDSAFVKGTKTGNNGRFSFTDINKGRYIVETTYLGYATAHNNVDIKSSNIRLDTIVMREADYVLGEVVVKGVQTEIKVKEDTIEYNAGAYRTQPNAVIEDLLKRLPGVEVDSEGKITSNGKEVTKILIEGKEFFSDDPKVASKNLPVNMIDKLQVVDRKSDLARLTGVDDGEEETVINLTVKKGMKNGWFGNIEGGYGTDSRYNANFNVNRFWNDNQFTLLGNFNNVNQLGFTDGNGARFRRFGGNSGITTSQALGVNFNVGNKEIFRVGGNVMYSHTDRDNRTSTEREYLNVPQLSSIGKYTRDKGHNLRADFRLQWNPDSFNSIDFRPRLSYNVNDSYSEDSTFVSSSDALRSAISRSYNTSASNGKSFEFGAQFIYNHKFKSRRGRSFSVDMNYSHSNVNEDEVSFSRNIFYLYNDSTDIYDQITRNHTWSDNISGRLTFTEPLGNVKNGRFIKLAYRLNYRWNSADKNVFDHPVILDPDGLGPVIDYTQELFNPQLSNQFRNDYFNQDVRLSFQQITSAINLEAGLSFVPTMSKSIDLINSDRNIPSRWVLNYAPFVNYRHKFSKTRSLNFRYNGRSSQPSLNQLQPVPDMSDPMNIIQGNPSLKPTFSHSMNLRFQDFNPKSQRSIMLMANASIVQNSIISMMTRDQTTGAQTTTYTNVNGVWNAMLANMISFPLRNKLWQFSNNIFANMSHGVGFNNGMRNNSEALRINLSPAISFRPENLEFELRPRYGLQYTHNSIPTNSSNKPTVHNFGGSFSAYYRTPVDIILASDVTYTATRGYSQGYNKNEWLWNASVSYETLRDKSLTLSVKAYDLLNQQSNISRTSTGNYIQDQRFNSLTRYFMFSVSYRFNTFGKGNEPGSRNRRGPGGFGGHGPGGHGGPGRRM